MPEITQQMYSEDSEDYLKTFESKAIFKKIAWKSVISRDLMVTAGVWGPKFKPHDF